MRVFVCKNHDGDGDLCLTVFTTEELAAEFCTVNPTFAYYRINITDNVQRETFKYEQGMMSWVN